MDVDHNILGTLSFIMDCGYNLAEVNWRIKIIRGEPTGDHEPPELFRRLNYR